MAHVVTLDMDELAGDPSPGLLADMQEARCDMQDATLSDSCVQAGSVSGRDQRWRREDLRQHAQGVFDGVVLDGASSSANLSSVGVNRHWLLCSVFGRDVLKACLAQVQPELKVSRWRMQPELDGWLQDAVVALGLLDMPEPTTFRTRIQYFIRLSRAFLEYDSAGRTLSPL